MMTLPTPPNQQVTEQQARYYALIDRLLACPSGEEPEILAAEADLLDAGFVQTLMQTASYFAHQDNSEAAKFLVFIARELARQLGLYTQGSAVLKPS